MVWLMGSRDEIGGDFLERLAALWDVEAWDSSDARRWAFLALWGTWNTLTQDERKAVRAGAKEFGLTDALEWVAGGERGAI